MELSHIVEERFNSVVEIDIEIWWIGCKCVQMGPEHTNDGALMPIDIVVPILKSDILVALTSQALSYQSVRCQVLRYSVSSHWSPISGIQQHNSEWSFISPEFSCSPLFEPRRFISTPHRMILFLRHSWSFSCNFVMFSKNEIIPFTTLGVYWWYDSHGYQNGES